MYAFTREREVAGLLVDELDLACVVANKPGGPSELETKLIAKTLADGIAIWRDLLPKMLMLLYYEEHG